MKIALLSLVLSSAAFAYTTNLYPKLGYIEMYNCDKGVRATFNEWTTDKATLSLQGFRLAGPGVRCPQDVQRKSTYVVTREITKTGAVWYGVDGQSRKAVRVYDYRKGAGPLARPQAPFIVEEYDANGNSIRKLYPPTGSRG